MSKPPFGETPQQRATYIKWAFNDDINTCNRHCDYMAKYDKDFYEKVKINLVIQK